MDNSALLEAIRSLSAWETRNFRRWLESPAFNTHPTPIRLFDYLLSCVVKKLEPEVAKALAEMGSTDLFGQKTAL